MRTHRHMIKNKGSFLFKKKYFYFGSHILAILTRPESEKDDEESDNVRSAWSPTRVRCSEIPTSAMQVLCDILSAKQLQLNSQTDEIKRLAGNILCRSIPVSCSMPGLTLCKDSRTEIRR